jgi:NitT/TauT family transport system substrate-binding protein
MQGLIATVLIAGLALQVGCNEERSAAGQPPKEVRLAYFANVTHAQGVLAVHSGEFAKAIAPSALTPRVFNAGPSVIEALNAGEIDIAYIGPGPAINAHAKSNGTSVRVICGVSSNGVLIVARGDAGISTLADLKGRKIATPQQGNTQDISARQYVRSQLRQPDAGNVLGIANAEQAGMMARGQIDAAWAPEPWGSRLLAEVAGAKLIGKEEDLWPDKQFNLALVITTPEFLRDHPQTVEKVLQVHRSWTARLAAEPEKHTPLLGEALLKLTGKQLPAGVLPAAVKNVRFTDDPLPATLETMGRSSYELGFLNEPVKIDGLVDLTLLKKLEAAGPPPR